MTKHRLRAPSVLSAMMALAFIKVSLALAGFERTWRWMRGHAVRRPPCEPIDDARVREVEYAVALAAALYPGRAACLERSLLLAWYLRRAGVAVQLRMGVQMYPFLAHAWVEHRGVVINDVPEHVRRFRPIEGVAP